MGKVDNNSKRREADIRVTQNGVHSDQSLCIFCSERSMLCRDSGITCSNYRVVPKDCPLRKGPITVELKGLTKGIEDEM